DAVQSSDTGEGEIEKHLAGGATAVRIFALEGLVNADRGRGEIPSCPDCVHVSPMSVSVRYRIVRSWTVRHRNSKHESDRRAIAAHPSRWPTSCDQRL